MLFETASRPSAPSFTRTGPAVREAVLQVHPGYVIHRKLSSLWKMLAVFERAHKDNGRLRCVTGNETTSSPARYVYQVRWNKT